jgi:signal transduction histidine kinase
MLATVAAWVRFTRRAQRLAELQMEFVAGISHELRTPLTVIHTAAYNLQGKLANHPSQVERYGKLIQQESGRLKDIVEQVLHFTSAKAGRVIQQREPVEIEEVINQTIESSRTVVEAAHCTVEKKIETGLPPVEGDARALQLALENLVGNAAKYGSNGKGWIGISASTVAGKHPPEIEIRVADRGPGIPADEQKNIFAPFFRGRRAVADQVHGTGLGLNLVKKIVEAHGGRVAVKSRESEGTEFVLRLPALEVPGEAPGAVQ